HRRILSGAIQMSATTTPASRIWQAASARLIEIEGFIPTPRGIALLPPRPLAWPEKDPGDTLDYTFDVAPASRAARAMRSPPFRPR
ncbi:hypothetical protein, partial [Acidiphilium sp. PM]|uniref:hypothetical protein n=1 Tax=Acidiphilium sp. PM TaxID=1043206 RepID=UPI0019D70D99